MTKTASQALEYEDMKLRVVPVRRGQPRTERSRIIHRKAMRQHTHDLRKLPTSEILWRLAIRHSKGLQRFYKAHSVGVWQVVTGVVFVCLIVSNI